ncbi:MAG TPA: hypoxanthine phosphoribosyltransferase [Armatimonadota bacterium]|jgi:hypoxanthine phosphoribosyltransferase
MTSNIETVLFAEQEIACRVRELGQQISRDYDGLRPALVCVLQGAVVFAADLMRAISVPFTVDFMAVSSYGEGTASSGVVRIIKDLDESVQGRHVIVVEDIVDSGRTLEYLLRVLRQRNPESLKVCALLDKPECRVVEVAADYVGFHAPDAFLVGYGLDYAQEYRGLPYLGALKPRQ